MNNDIYILPTESIVDTTLIEPTIVQSIRGRGMIQRRENLIPFVRLSSTFNEINNNPENQDKLLIVVVTTDTGMIGFIVDEFLDHQEVVVKSLGNYPGDIKVIAGTTIIGDGRVVSLLDVNSLAKRAIQSGGFITITPSGYVAA